MHFAPENYVAAMVLGGVFERHPHLRFGVIELSASWIGPLAERLDMTQSAISHQLRGLRQMHLVRARKSGRQVFYCLDDDHVTRLFSLGLDHIQHG